MARGSFAAHAVTLTLRRAQGRLSILSLKGEEAGGPGPKGAEVRVKALDSGMRRDYIRDMRSEDEHGVSLAVRRGLKKGPRAVVVASP